MKKGKMANIICGLIWICQAVAEFAAAAAIWRLGMLPDKYFVILAAVLVAVWALVGVIFFLPKAKKKIGAFLKNKKLGIGLFRRFTGCVISFAMIFGCMAVSNVASDVYSAVDGITGAAEVIHVAMSVYVMADDPAQTISDLSGGTFAVLDGYDTQRMEKAVEAIGQELNGNLTVQHYGSLTELVDALYEGQADAIILNGAYVSLLEDTEDYMDFPMKTRILYTAMLEEEAPVYKPEPLETTLPQSTDETQPVQKPFRIDEDPFIMYISGSDTRDYYLTTSRSDVNILMVVNPKTKMVLLLNTPRDYFVANPAGGGAMDKLTHCGIYGTACSMDALEGLYGINIRYYAQINFTGVETLVDAVGGVDVYSDVAFTASWTTPIQVGWNHLNGEQTLHFARDRYSHAGGDNTRGRNQMKVIQALIGKFSSSETIVKNYAAILDSIQGMFKTDVTSEEIGALVKMQLEDLAQWNIVTYAVTGTGGSDITYSMPGLYCYVTYPNQDTVDYGAELIQRVFDGEILTSEDMICP